MMKGMGLGHKNWQVESNEREKACAMDNTKLDIKEYDAEASIWLSTVIGSGL
jgi:hypothetical protein